MLDLRLARQRFLAIENERPFERFRRRRAGVSVTALAFPPLLPSAAAA
jgi:hypothetical protein